jgi:hypothetical protein
VSVFLGTNADAATEGTPDAVTGFYNRDSLNPIIAFQSQLNVSGWADTAALSVSNLFSSTIWTSVPTASVPGQPTLTVTVPSPGQIQLAWSPATLGFVLQETSTLPGGWTNSISGATNPVIVTPSARATCYRLIQP